MVEPQTNDPEYCPNCGAKMNAYWRRIEPVMVRALQKAYRRAKQAGTNEVKMGELKEFSRAEYADFHRLKLFGLIEPVVVDGKARTGHYRITPAGVAFLFGRVKVHKSVKVFRFKIMEVDPEMVGVEDVIGTIPFVDTIEDLKTERMPLRMPI